MDCVKTCFILVVLTTLINFHQCGRYGGSRGGGSRGSYSSHSYSRSSPSHYSHPSPSHYSYPAPSPSYSRPATPVRNPRPSPPPRTYTPSRPSPPAYESPIRVTSSPSLQGHRPVSTSRPWSAPHSTSRPFSPPIRASSVRPYESQRPGYQSVSTRRPVYQPATTRRPLYSGTTPRNIRYSTRSPFYGSSNNNNAGWNLPPRPGSGPVGPPRYGYDSYSSGPQKIKIVNKYNYHYPGYYSLPVAQHYPGYFYTPSYYSYGVGDTGSTALGFYLGYSLSRLTTPTYSHYSFYDGYRPRYDHYTVHHYYHNRESVPQTQEIRANTIIGCVGDSAAICPANTTSLCTSNGALMCVASALSTVPCTDNRQNNCVTSTISCVNNTAPECKNSNQQATTVSIPCISKAELYGDLKTVNGTIIPANVTLNGTVAGVNGTVTGVNGTVINGTVSTNGTTNVTVTNEISTQYPITTMPTVPRIVSREVHENRKKRDVPQNYCVTILALPAERKSTQGEEFLNDAKFIANKFFDSVWDV